LPQTLHGDEFTVSQAARALNLSVSRIKQLTDAGQLACRRTPLGRIISRAALEDFARGRNINARKEHRMDDYAIVGQFAPDVLLPWATARIAQDAAMIVEAARAENELHFSGHHTISLSESGHVLVRDDHSGRMFTLAQPSECIQVAPE
jgi:hypothetical protein